MLLTTTADRSLKVTTSNFSQRAATASGPGDGPHRAIGGVLTSLALTALLSSLGTSIANVGLPTLAQAFEASFQQIQWVVLAYLLATTTLIVSAGRLGDLFGRRRMLLVGIALFSSASLLCALAPSLALLIAARAVQGLGAALMMSLAMALVGESMAKEKTGSAMGILGTVSALGTAMGPSLGGVLIDACGWPMIFLLTAALGGLTWLMAQRFLPRDRSPGAGAQPRFDLVGTLLLTLTLGAYALAMTLGQDHFGALNGALLIAAGLALALFIRAQRKTLAPLIQLSLFSNPALSVGFAMSAVVTTVVMATLVVGPFYLAGGLALNAAQVGLVMASGPLVAALVGVPAGRIVDLWGAGRMTLAGLSAMATGCGLLAISPLAWGVTANMLALMVLTAGYALFQAANNTAVMIQLRAPQRGVGAGLLGLSRNLGLITGASVMGMVFALGAGVADPSTAHPPELASAMRLTFGVASMLVISTLALGLALQRRLQRAAGLISVAKVGSGHE